MLDLLLDLIEHRERVVTRDELIERVWHGRIVAEATLSSRIKSARRAIGDNGRDQALIRTVHGRGFRFVGIVRAAPKGGQDRAAPPVGGAAAPGSRAGAPTPIPDPLARGEAGREPAAAADADAARSVSLVGGRRTATERRQLTIVRCSLADSALALAARDAEELDDFLSRARAILVTTFEAFGGQVARTYSAGVLVYFGWPRASEDAPQRAVQAALAVGPALGRLGAGGGPPAEARCGIATGIVVVGSEVANQPSRLAGGRAPVLAARLMDLAGPGMVVVAASTRALLGQAFVFERHGAEPLAGRGDGDGVWQVLGAPTSRPASRPARGSRR